MSELRPPLWADLQPGGLVEALAHPPDRYRPVPWLAWTGELDWPTLESQLRQMREQGITEFFLFPIYGMEIPYMSQAYWDRVEQTLDFCRAKGMKCWIYDEYDWPSGVCAGQVLRDHPEAREQLLWVRALDTWPEGQLPPGASEVRTAGGAAWGVGPGGEVRINVQGCDWLSPFPGYLDVLSPSAVGDFIESTHERYRARAGSHMASTIPGFFTDEPGPMAREAGGWVGFPYTTDLFESFRARYGYDLADHLSDLLTDGPNASRTRCHYWRWVAERFGEAYGGSIRAWGDAHGVAMTGHCLGEETLGTHVRMSGDLWEPLKHFSIPGIDMLSNADGYTYPEGTAFYGPIDRRAFHLTCKYVHGVVRHTGGREMMSEAYGVCDWGLTLARQKRGLQYQAALGVTLFNDNSLITSIADFRKYAIAGKHFTQPWWRHYRAYADLNARLAAIHAEGEPMADVAVLFPRSTMWSRTNREILAGSWLDGANGKPLGDLQEALYALLDDLVRGLWPFDLVFEPVLEEARVEGRELVTPHARYRALIVPSATDLPEGCMGAIEAFARGGGAVVFAGEIPQREVESQADLGPRVDAMLRLPTVRHAMGANDAASGTAGVARRPVELSGDGSREFVSSWRRLAGTDIAFVANMADRPTELTVHCGLPGPVAVVDPDTLDCFAPSLTDDRRFDWHFEPAQGYLVLMGPGAHEVAKTAVGQRPAWLEASQTAELDGPWDLELDPGNLLLLEPEVRPDPSNRGAVDGWQRDEGAEGWIRPEGRRLAEAIRPGESPWYWIRARVVCAPGATPDMLVADNPDFLEAYVNGAPAEPMAARPLWTEENVCFDVRGLFREGTNTVHVRGRTSKYNDPRVSPMPGVTDHLLQPLVLMGSFRVAEDGQVAAWEGAADPARPLEAQGMPHFAGVATYRRSVVWSGNGRVFLELPGCTDSVDVRINGDSAGVRCWPPYVVEITEQLRAGANTLEVRIANMLGNVILETYAGAAPPRRPTSGLKAAPRLRVIR